MHAVPQSDQAPNAQSETAVSRRFARLIERGCPVKPQGSAANFPDALLARRLPKHLVTLNGHRFFVTHVRRDQQFRFFVAYVQLQTPTVPEHRRPLHPRIFYKDSSLVWRVATHYINTETEHWIGKGDIKPVVENGETHWYSAEETTNLPFEIQNALDTISRRATRPRPDRQALELVLRSAPDDRVRPYADFSTPRKRAMQDRQRAIHNNKPVAWFSDDHDPKSLLFAGGYEPDFRRGLIDKSQSRSKLYGGDIERFRIASRNRRIQYLFMRAPNQSWIIPPQPIAIDLMSYGVHTVDANVDEKLCIPGYEYHFADPLEVSGVFSQIPRGFAGASSTIDPQRADASLWTHAMPVMKRFHAALAHLRRAKTLAVQP
ncbi:MAG: hypothetical protein AAF465_00330 [Pseudomonadota bacterium]